MPKKLNELGPSDDNDQVPLIQPDRPAGKRKLKPPPPCDTSTYNTPKSSLTVSASDEQASAGKHYAKGLLLPIQFHRLGRRELYTGGNS